MTLTTEKTDLARPTIGRSLRSFCSEIRLDQTFEFQDDTVSDARDGATALLRGQIATVPAVIGINSKNNEPCFGIVRRLACTLQAVEQMVVTENRKVQCSNRSLSKGNIGKHIHRLRRLLASGSPLLFAGGVALAGVAIASLNANVGVSKWIVWPFLAAWIALLMFHMIAEYRRRTYDPTWVLKFDDKFDNEEMRGRRSKAARALRDNRTRLGSPDFSCSELDDVLDFLEALGFFMQGDQITPEVAHHAFHHWILGYYSAAYEYLNTAREKDPSNWEFVEMLVTMTNEIERERIKKIGKHLELLSQSEIDKFLNEEIDQYTKLRS